MIVDLHAHYAMHLQEELQRHPARVVRWILSSRRASSLRARSGREARIRRRRALFLSLLGLIIVAFNYRSLTSGPGVTLELMKKGSVAVVLSPLYDPLDELGAISGWILAVAGLAAGMLLALLAAALLGVASLTAHFAGHAAGAGETAHLVLSALEVAGVLVVAILVLVAALALHNRLASPGSALDELPGTPPRSVYFHDLLGQHGRVEEDVQLVGDWACVAHNMAELEAALQARKIALVHCVEGGFQLGPLQDVERNVACLATRGIAYVTLAHLVWRGVATNAPAMPFLSDRMYRWIFHEPRQGLTELGRAAVQAMFRNGVLIDVTHMNQQAIDETFALLEKLEGGGPPVPVIASHMACRFGTREYNLSPQTIQEIGRRKGVMGVIFCDHWMRDGPRACEPRSVQQTFEVVRDHIERIRDLTGCYDYAAIGSDLDGFIKPMLRGLEHMGRMGELQRWLLERYDEPTARGIACDNALRVLRSAWGRIPGVPAGT